MPSAASLIKRSRRRANLRLSGCRKRPQRIILDYLDVSETMYNKAMELQTFIFIGRSGCGKGTQISLLQEYIKKQDNKRHIFYIETGERFRQFIKEHSLSSRLAAEIYKTGNRQPDFIAVWMWSHLLVDRVTGGEHIVFDGTPRSLQEAQIIDTAIDFYSRQRPHVLFKHLARDF